MAISGESRRIHLRGGGTLSVRLEGASWMHFDADERALLCAIADAMHTYEMASRVIFSTTTTLEGPSPPAAPSGAPDWLAANKNGPLPEQEKG